MDEYLKGILKQFKSQEGERIACGLALNSDTENKYFQTQKLRFDELMKAIDNYLGERDFIVRPADVVEEEIPDVE